MLQKPFSQACDNNKSAIFEVLRDYLTAPANLLEIGSGTGQHGVFFAENLPQVQWQTSDLEDNHEGILAWISDYEGGNLCAPFALNVADEHWDIDEYNAVFTANTAHIMSWPQVESMVRGVAKCLLSSGLWIIYGPFNYGGQFTSDSNARFNDWLQTQAPYRAIRDFEALRDCALAKGLELIEDRAMPANNRCLVFRKSSGL